MRHGLTIIELLASLALLSLVMVTAVEWTRFAGRVGSDLAEPTDWERSARRALELIAEDLRCAATPRRRGERVEIDASVLVIHTRQAYGTRRGPVEHRYRHDSIDGVLEVDERTAWGGSTRRSLLDAVSAWSCAIEGDDDAELVVTLRGPADVEIERRYRVP